MENNSTTHNKSHTILIWVILVVLVLIASGVGVFVWKHKSSKKVSQQVSVPKTQSSIYFVPETVNQNTFINSTQSAQLVVKPQSEFDEMAIQFKFDPTVVKEITVIPTQYKNEKLRQYTIKSTAIDYEHGLVTLRFNQADGTTANLPLKRGIKVADIQYQLAQPLTKATSLFTFTGRTALVKKVEAPAANSGSTNVQSSAQTHYESILNSAPPLKVSQ